MSAHVTFRMVRVVAGTARGIRLDAPPGRATRPTSDRVREATFNALGSLGLVEGASILDLFAGSGAMGIEALSRGAVRATFVDNDRTAVDSIQANLDATKLAPAGTVVRADAVRFAAGHAFGFDLAIIDPPYAFDGWHDLLATLPVPVAVIESDRPVDPGNQWAVVRSRRYGSTVVVISCRRDDPEETKL
ncbi:MAG TPA: 16S rRNA (guanine(966)-N(2))-methyltransferase RsmD [Acidimicrobiales bacterium]